MIFSATYERVAYKDAFQASMDRLRLGAKGTFASLFRLRGNRLEFYRLFVLILMKQSKHPHPLQQRTGSFSVA